MKRIIALALACASLAGCAAYRDTWYGSWLDQIGKPQAAEPIPQAQAAQLRAQAAELRAQAEVIRTKMAVEPDRVRRIAYQRELRDIGDKLHPIEETLRRAPVVPGA